MASFKALIPSPIQGSGHFVSPRGKQTSFARHLRAFLALLVVAGVLLAACAPAAPAPTAAAPTTAPVPTTVPPTAAPAPTEAAPTVAPTPATTAISLVDGLQRPITLPKPAERIVTLSPSVTEILFAIGAGKQVVGVDQFSDYPAEAKSLPSVGAGFDKLNTEQILALKPDLVLAADTIAADKIKSLQDLGLTVFSLSNPVTLDQMYDSLRTVAQLSGHSVETETLIASLKDRVKAVEAKVANAKTQPLVLYEIDATDPNAPWTSGPGTFMDTLIHMAGGRNIGAVLKSDWAQMSLEEVIKQNPDFIFLGDFTLGGITPEMVKARSGWGGITAVKQSQVYTIDDNTISRPGPRLVDGLETIAKTLHPELFK
jgi:iron complex transport system substrate-binding protein